jgi:hypothetical protein
MTLDEFEAELKAIIGSPATSHRPFVCEGSPLECDIFLVGIEPATSLNSSFWDFWEGGYGFKKREWYKSYCRERIESGEYGPSPTRKNIEHFVDGASPVRVLETNISSMAVKRFNKKNKIYDEAFSFLIKSIKPKVFHVHGEPAWNEMDGFVRNFDMPGKILKEYHLSFQTGKEKASGFGRRAAALALTMRRT